MEIAIMPSPQDPIEKLRKIMRVSRRVRQDQMRGALEMDAVEFNKVIFDWAEEFHFSIDGDFVNFDGADVEQFIVQLDRQFATWGNKEGARAGKTDIVAEDEKEPAIGLATLANPPAVMVPPLPSTGISSGSGDEIALKLIEERHRQRRLEESPPPPPSSPSSQAIVRLALDKARSIKDFAEAETYFAEAKAPFVELFLKNPLDEVKQNLLEVLRAEEAAFLSHNTSNPAREKRQKHTYKILVASAGLVGGFGKTALCHKFVYGIFKVDSSWTAGIDFHAKDIEMNGVAYSLLIYDFGDYRFREFFPLFMRGAKGAILLYDMTKEITSLDNLEECVGICRAEDKSLPILLCGTKLDLVDERSGVGDYAKGFLQPLGMFDYLQVSAKTGENVEKAFETLVKKITERQEKGQ